MPKSYSEQERAYIRERLKEEAADCLATYGVRRTTVDEIVRRVNIPKGTFYLFYQSKELLLFEVIQEQQQSINRRLFQVISGLSGTKVSAEELTDAIYAFYKMAEEMPILKLIGTGEVELLARRLPREVVQAHLQDDTGNARDAPCEERRGHKCRQRRVPRSLLRDPAQSGDRGGL